MSLNSSCIELRSGEIRNLSALWSTMKRKNTKTAYQASRGIL
ncbi:MAG: hypothetical protein ACPL4E_02150 [Thermoproteota archaeon]